MKSLIPFSQHKVAALIRVSTNKQDLRAQKSSLKFFYRDKGWQLPPKEWIKQEKTSAFRDNALEKRTGLRDLVDACESHELNGFVAVRAAWAFGMTTTPPRWPRRWHFANRRAQRWAFNWPTPDAKPHPNAPGMAAATRQTHRVDGASLGRATSLFPRRIARRARSARMRFAAFSKTLPMRPAAPSLLGLT